MSGRPCRRGLDVRRRNDGVLAVLNGDADADGAAAFFCWQHKDQAASFVSPSPSTGAAHLYTLQERTSTDTLVERLGLMDLAENRPKRKKRVPPARKERLPEKWQEIPGPLMKVSTSKRPRRRPHPLLSFLCCGGSESESHQIVPRREEMSLRQNASLPAHIRTPTNPPNRPSLPRDPSSQTQGLLGWIPKSLSPQTTSQLLAELAKPISEHDEEGYIYMFWLTTAPAPDASTLLTPSPTPSPRARGPATSSLQPRRSNETILLKIGRASNVQRRMNEWTRQCGYNLSLIRFYPYFPQTSPSASTPPRKVPHAHKVERLIHIELAARRVKRDCETCGKEHREWFEVSGDRRGVKGVDEVVRRWVRWGETSH
ncbi:MAG: hypothetical protein Q9216_003188 [Gyalolechia sp. 2 TL-2023]